MAAAPMSLIASAHKAEDRFCVSMILAFEVVFMDNQDVIAKPWILPNVRCLDHRWRRSREPRATCSLMKKPRSPCAIVTTCSTQAACRGSDTSWWSYHGALEDRIFAGTIFLRCLNFRTLLGLPFTCVLFVKPHL
ncbi:hypothetical protein MRX96_017821 [Rhipicephalus microplus]